MLDPNRVVLADGNVRVSLPWFLAKIGGDWTGRTGDAAVPEAAFMAYIARQGAPVPPPAEPLRQWFRDRGYFLDVATSTPFDVGLNPGEPPERGRVVITPAFERLLAGGGSTYSSTTPILLLGGAAILGLWFFAGSRSSSGMRGIRTRRRRRRR